MALFNIPSAKQLTCKQRVENSAEVRSQRVLDELRVKLGVVKDLDWTRSGQQRAQRRQRFRLLRITVAKSVDVNDVHD